MGSYDAAATRNKVPKIRATPHQTIVSTRRSPNAVVASTAAPTTDTCTAPRVTCTPLRSMACGPRTHMAHRIQHVLNGGHRKQGEYIRIRIALRETNLESVSQDPRSLARIRGEHCRVWKSSVINASVESCSSGTWLDVDMHTGSTMPGKMVLASENGFKREVGE